MKPEIFQIVHAFQQIQIGPPPMPADAEHHLHAIGLAGARIADFDHPAKLANLVDGPLLANRGIFAQDVGRLPGR